MEREAEEMVVAYDAPSDEVAREQRHFKVRIPEGRVRLPSIRLVNREDGRDFQVTMRPIKPASEG
jgi:hypothetical protein